MIAAANCSYHFWVNNHREKAFLRKCARQIMLLAITVTLSALSDTRRRSTSLSDETGIRPDLSYRFLTGINHA